MESLASGVTLGIELELAFLLVLSNLGQIVFARFEIETARWRKLLKWTLVHVGTVALYFAIGHWSLVWPSLAVLVGATVHVVWCRRHEIHPLNATPLDRYYELRGWAPPAAKGMGAGPT